MTSGLAIFAVGVLLGLVLFAVTLAVRLWFWEE